MKKRHIIALAFLMVSTGIHAQSLWDRSKPDHNFTFGLRAGINFASTDMDYATSTRTGFRYGTQRWCLYCDWSRFSGSKLL